MAVEGCSEGVLGLVFGHGKSPWFSRCSFVWSVSVDVAVLSSALVNIQDIMD